MFVRNQRVIAMAWSYGLSRSRVISTANWRVRGVRLAGSWRKRSRAQFGYSLPAVLSCAAVGSATWDRTRYTSPSMTGVRAATDETSAVPGGVRTTVSTLDRLMLEGC